MRSPRPNAYRRGYGPRWERAPQSRPSRTRKCSLPPLSAARTACGGLCRRPCVASPWYSEIVLGPICRSCHNAKAAQEQANYRTGKPIIRQRVRCLRQSDPARAPMEPLKSSVRPCWIRKDGELLEFVSARPGWLVYENDQQRCYTLGPVLHRRRGEHIVAKTPPQRLR